MSRRSVVSTEVKTQKVIANCDQFIARRIRMVRGVQVMLDRDIAELYGVETKVLNQAVKRNAERFPSDFMFRLSDVELKDWKSQIVTSNLTDAEEAAVRMGIRRNPCAFTENGVAMLSGILRSKKAVETNIRIIRAFVAMHNFGSSINCLGRRVTTYTTRDKKEIAKVLNEI